MKEIALAIHFLFWINLIVSGGYYIGKGEYFKGLVSLAFASIYLKVIFYFAQHGSYGMVWK